MLGAAGRHRPPMKRQAYLHFPLLCGREPSLTVKSAFLSKRLTGASVELLTAPSSRSDEQALPLLALKKCVHCRTDCCPGSYNGDVFHS